MQWMKAHGKAELATHINMVNKDDTADQAGVTPSLVKDDILKDMHQIVIEGQKAMSQVADWLAEKMKE